MLRRPSAAIGSHRPRATTTRWVTRGPEMGRRRIHRQQQITAAQPLRLFQEIGVDGEIRSRLQQHQIDTAGA